MDGEKFWKTLWTNGWFGGMFPTIFGVPSIYMVSIYVAFVFEAWDLDAEGQRLTGSAKAKEHGTTRKSGGCDVYLLEKKGTSFVNLKKPCMPWIHEMKFFFFWDWNQELCQRLHQRIEIMHLNTLWHKSIPKVQESVVINPGIFLP